jgi:hypothetical protein
VRKMRVLFWTGIGVILLARRGLQSSDPDALAAMEAAEQEQPASS